MSLGWWLLLGWLIKRRDPPTLALLWRARRWIRLGIVLLAGYIVTTAGGNLPWPFS